MLADERARALGANFAGQWLYLRNLKAKYPIDDIFPDFDDNLRKSMSAKRKCSSRLLCLRTAVR